MEAVKISSKFQVVIPHEVREIADMCGFLQGIDTAVERETDRLCA